MFFQKLFCSWPSPVPLHAFLTTATERVTCYRTPQRSTREAYGLWDDRNRAKYVSRPAYACITLNPPLSVSLFRPVSGYRWPARWHGILLSKTGASHMPPFPWKAVFPVRQAYAGAKSCCYIRGLVYFIVLSVCSRHPRTSGTVTAQNERTEQVHSSYDKCGINKLWKGTLAKCADFFFWLHLIST